MENKLKSKISNSQTCRHYENLNFKTRKINQKKIIQKKVYKLNISI